MDTAHWFDDLLEMIIFGCCHLAHKFFFIFFIFLVVMFEKTGVVLHLSTR